jgi:hypothetical protein
MTFVVCPVLHEFQIPGLEGILVDLNKHCAIQRYNMLDDSSTEVLKHDLGTCLCVQYTIYTTWTLFVRTALSFKFHQWVLPELKKKIVSRCHNGFLMRYL